MRVLAGLCVCLALAGCRERIEESLRTETPDSQTDAEPPPSLELAPTNIAKLQTFVGSVTTGEKPQSKVWLAHNRFWCVIADKTGTWVRRLDGNVWTQVLKLSASKTVKADAKVVADVVHILLFNGSTASLASIEYVEGASPTYKLWSTRATLTAVSLGSGAEIATIDVDSTGRMWLASDTSSSIVARYSDAPYAAWSQPVTIAPKVSSDDISSVVAFSDQKIGIFWSDQTTKRFGFRTHADGTPPATWTANESPASASALAIGHGFADDHIHLATASDGTLYVSIKTSYDDKKHTLIGLLVRRPDGRWDPIYHLDTVGTRGIVMVSETQNLVRVIYTSATGGGNIVARDSPRDRIAFGGPKVLLSGFWNDATSMKQNFDRQMVVLAADGKLNVGGVLLSE